MQLGAISPYDTVITPQLKLKSPVLAGDTWAYSPYQYNGTIKEFVQSSSIDSMSCVDTLIYVEVPAGIFPCVEYEYSYPYTAKTRSADINSDLELNGLWIPELTNTRAEATGVITVKLHYSRGVGYVQGITYFNGQIVTRKVLTNYTVEEK